MATGSRGALDFGKRRARRIGTTRFGMRKDSKGRLGVVMDHNLTIIGVNSWARQFGARVGMKILKCHGTNVRTTSDVNACTKTMFEEEERVTCV